MHENLCGCSHARWFVPPQKVVYSTGGGLCQVKSTSQQGTMMLEVVIKVFILLAMVGVEVLGIRLLEGNVVAGIVLVIIGIIGIIGTLILLFWRRIHPVKLKVNELSWWHIERPEPEHHGWSHCHEYNFAGEMLFNPRAEVTAKAFYLNLPINGFLRIDHPWTPESNFHFLPSRKIIDTYSFQIRTEEQLQVPSYAYIIMEFEHGKVKRKVRLKHDDNYRPNLGISQRTELK